MITLMNNLYPPSIDPYLPTFVVNEGGNVIIPFKLSKYNSISEISNKAQIVITRQDTNISVINSKTSANGIVFVDVVFDENGLGGIVTIPQSYFNPAPEICYKFQMRFITYNSPILNEVGSSVNANLSTINQYIQDYSEWSTVGILYGIYQPQLTINGFDKDKTSTDEEFQVSIIDLYGRLNFINEDRVEATAKERLRSYNIKLLNDIDTVVFESGWIDTNRNESYVIDYTLPYKMASGLKYTLSITYLTSSLYTDTETFTFVYQDNLIEKLPYNITAYSSSIPYSIDHTFIDEEVPRMRDNAYIKIEISPKEGSTSFMGNIALRRNSNKNPNLWEDIKVFKIINASMNQQSIIYRDFTIESGVFYKYEIQKINTFGERGEPTTIVNPVMCEFNDVYLCEFDGDEWKQLGIKLNPQITNFKRNIFESKTDTLGGKYPKIQRNGRSIYRSFSISGTIAHQMDLDGFFTTKDIIYKEDKSLYNTYNVENRISENYDYIYEKEFRDRVMDFLYNKKPKLYKSSTEGNMIVKVMNPTFTPNKTLGRMLYDFSAEIVEIAELNIKNLKALKLWDSTDYLSSFATTYLDFGFVSTGTVDKQKATDIFEIINNNYAMKSSEIKYSTKQLSWVQIEMQIDPYPIYQNGSEKYSVEPPSEKSVPYLYGYLIEINGKQIIINRNGLFQIAKDEGVLITSLETYGAANVVYECYLEQEEADIKEKPYLTRFYDKIGHIHGEFNFGYNLYTDMYNSNNIFSIKEDGIETTKTIYTMQKVKGITIEGPVGASIFIKDSSDNVLYEHIINETGILNLHNDDINFNLSLDNIVVSGIYKMHERVEYNPRIPLREYEYHILSSDEKYTSDGMVVTGTDNQNYCYYNNKLYPFVDNTVQCPVSLSIDYLYVQSQVTYKTR